MKPTALLLSVFVLLMTLVPCNWDDLAEHRDAQQCCLTHKAKGSSHGKTSCPCGHCCCSPFSSCNGCTGFINPKRVECQVAVAPPCHQVPTPYSEGYVHLFYRRIWQPPQ